MKQHVFGSLLNGLLALMVSANLAGASPQETVRPHAGMLRYPDVSKTHIVFVYANDIWLVPREGGLASPVASPPGQELFPRFSPDGQTLAFVGNYDGDNDIYTMPVSGGVPVRVTHHPGNEIISEWSPDNKIIFFSSGVFGLSRQTHILTVAPGGGLPEKLPVPYGANGAINEAGQWLAYTPHSRDFRTWKRYRGGMATDIWLFNLKNYSAEKITDWEGTDTYPMWHQKMVYYLSDACANHRLNIWAYNTECKERRQITQFKEFDVKFPAIGPGPNGQGEIVFQNGEKLYLLDLATSESKAVQVQIPGARPKIRPKLAKVNDLIFEWQVSSTGKRVLVEARGDIWTLPAEKGSILNLTRTSGVAERDPAWSPDGRWIAFFSDSSGEYELYIMESNGKGQRRQLTSGGKAFRHSPAWSPDSKKIAFTDKTGSVYVHHIKEKETKLADKDPWGYPPQFNWSHDSSWIVYAKGGENRLRSIWFYNLKTGKATPATGGYFQDSAPVFDRKGEYLFFASNRQFDNAIYDDIGHGLGNSFVYTGTEVLIALPLKKDVKNPYLPENDEEQSDDEKKKDDKKKDDGEKNDEPEKNNNDDCDSNKDKPQDKQAGKEKTDAKDKDTAKKNAEDKDEPKPLEIDFDGLEARAFQIPISNGSFSQLAVNHEAKLVYVRHAPRGSDGKDAIKIFDLKDEKKEEKNALVDIGSFRMTSDGKKLLVRKGDTFHIVNAAPDQKLEKPISTSDMAATINPREEWAQILKDAWRIQRDFFYDPNMHGVNWQGIYDHYSKMLADCASREDVSYVISEMISELNVGHTYYFGGDIEEKPSTSVGMLGVDFELDKNAYRISKVYEGAQWDVDARGPLSHMPKDKIKAGDYMLAVNRVPIDPAKDPWAAFIGLANQTVILTVSDKPELDKAARDVTVILIANESSLRFRAWVEENRAYVEKKSNGAIGYIYVPNTGRSGQNELFRNFYGQMSKKALIVDERWNGGGQAPTRFIELLNRPVLNYWARRDGNDWPWPYTAHQGPKCMLINGLAGSGGDMFPALFRQVGLGKLIGTRTWGGLVGMSGNPRLVDGGYTSVPTFGYYELDGTWGIEGHGVDPDIEVVDNPALMVDGADPQLDAAIELMMKEIKERPFTPPQRPAYPDRSGMGVREEDK